MPTYFILIAAPWIQVRTINNKNSSAKRGIGFDQARSVSSGSEIGILHLVFAFTGIPISGSSQWSTFHTWLPCPPISATDCSLPLANFVISSEKYSIGGTPVIFRYMCISISIMSVSWMNMRVSAFDSCNFYWPLIVWWSRV